MKKRTEKSLGQRVFKLVYFTNAFSIILATSTLRNSTYSAYCNIVDSRVFSQLDFDGKFLAVVCWATTFFSFCAA